MIKHIVFWNIEGDDIENSINFIKNTIEHLRCCIPQIVSIEVGKNINDGEFNLALFSEFKTSEDLEIYQNHAEHQKLKTFMSGVCKKRACVDYII